MRQFSTFVDKETGVDEQPVAILLCRLQRQSRCQLILQEGQCHALLQVVRGGGQAGCQTTSTAGTREMLLLVLCQETLMVKRRGLNINTYFRLRPCMIASGPEDIGASCVGRQFLKSAHWTRESPLSAIRVLKETEMLRLRNIQSWKSHKYESMQNRFYQ